MKLAVVGAGWAGLAAALALHRAGHSVHLFEAGHQAGGRARTVNAPATPSPLTLDNGQHIMLGAYRDTLALMTSLGRPPEDLLLRLPLTLESADGSTQLRAPHWPAPLHALAALLGARGPGLKEKLLSALPLMRRPHGWPNTRRTTSLGDAPHADGKTILQGSTTTAKPPETVRLWLRRCRQSGYMVRTLWEPLCLAALNTPLDQACAVLFYRVLRDSLTGAASNSHLLIPRTDLGNLWPNAAIDELRSNPANTVRFGHTVRQLARPDTKEPASHLQNHNSTATTLVDGEPFDAVVLATSVASARRLLATLPAHTPAQEQYLHGLGTFTFLPIATLTLQLSQPWQEPMAMLMLRENRQRKHFGQWLFNQRVLNPQWPDRATVVISDASSMMACEENDAVACMIQQVREQTGGRAHPLPGIENHTIITEKRATFAAVPRLWRPENSSPWPGVWLAGDYTNTGYPAVLEGAVRSGLAAARGLSAAPER